jgi:UDP:flavonoid glycosyltransferase YjiC (YdhE family)
VVASLAHGVPLVCLPNAAGDQPALAAQVSSLGLGIALGGEDASPADIRAAVREVLTPSYPARAAHLAALIKATGGATTAADRLEALAKEA